MSSVQITDRTAEYIAKLKSGVEAGAAAAGTNAVKAVTEQMDSGYHTPHYSPRRGWHTAIIDTTTLIQSITYETEISDSSAKVTIGTPIEYAHFVHDGTSRVEARPFMKDAISAKSDELLNIWKQYIQAAVGG